jgi:hypothetical protein
MSGARLREGVGAGLIGGIVVAVWALLMSPILGTHPLHETRLAAASLLGDAALRSGNAPLALLVGGTCHLAVSIAWGMVFAFVCHRLPPIATLAAGAVFGVGVWLAMHRGLLPMLGLEWIIAGFSTARAITEHVVYGMGVALGLLAIRRATG